MKKLLHSATLLALLASPCLASGSHDDHGSHSHEVKADTYNIDVSHSRLGFKVSHLGITSVPGYFKDFSGSLSIAGDQLVGAKAEIKVPTIFTDNDKRDDHLRSDDFFSSDKFPAIKFESTSVKQMGKKITVMGKLTIRDVTKDIVLKGEFPGTVYVEMWKVTKAGLSLKGSINRQDYGLTFSKFLGTGEAMVGDVVEIEIDIEANKS